MRVLRNNKDSILAILQTFIYDPLLGWRAVHGSDAPSGTACVAAVAASDDETAELRPRDEDGASGFSPREVVQRIESKLVGRDFPDYGTLTSEDQVAVLIQQATSAENLC